MWPNAQISADLFTFTEEILNAKFIFLCSVLIWLHKSIVWRQGKTICYTDTDSFVVHIKLEDIHANISGDVEKKFDTPNNELDRPQKQKCDQADDRWIGLKIMP